MHSVTGGTPQCLKQRLVPGSCRCSGRQHLCKGHYQQPQTAAVPMWGHLAQLPSGCRPHLLSQTPSPLAHLTALDCFVSLLF